MRDAYPFLILEQPSTEAIAWITRQVNGAGLQVMRTFDFQVTRHDPADWPCPHHGTDQCDCHMVILLVYADSYRPITLVAHSHDGKTWFSLVNTPQQRADPHLEATIRQALTLQSIPPSDQTHWSHAT